ncbi:MAG TPA: hypothetical protein VK190_02480 [Pseudoneobacillus sp.]|nr:hypothetical protein [Pseudoneobacillus sp.]
MNVSEHCKERYVERIKGITEKLEIKQYLVDNGERIVDNINKMFEFSNFIFKGQIGGDKITRNFYIKDDTIFVTDTASSCIITLYKVDFGFPEDATKAAIKSLIREIEDLNTKIESEKLIIGEFTAVKQLELENIDSEIKNVQAQLDILKSKRQFAYDELTYRNADLQLFNKKAEQYATLLCNSLAFKLDVSRNMSTK